MKEIELKNNPLGIKVYTVGEPDLDHMPEEEYNLFASSFALYINEYVTKLEHDKEDSNAL